MLFPGGGLAGGFGYEDAHGAASACSRRASTTTACVVRLRAGRQHAALLRVQHVVYPTKMSKKLKQDAAKKIEPKLRELMENHKEEAERLQREANRELDYYRLNLYKCSNEEYRKETNKIRDNEERRMSHLENELRAKLESCRIEQENEMKKIREDYDQRADMMKRQFSADKQKFAEEHQINLIDAQKAEDLEMEHARVQHLKEMVDMEEEYTEQMAQKQKAIKE